MTESRCEIRARPWRRPEPPARILAIRLQAIGDVAVTLPYLRALQKTLPETEIGGCMESACRFGDVHCLTRYAPE
jgi:hypothetical protein